MVDINKRETLVMRTDKSIKDRLDKLAGKRKATLTSLINEALEIYLNNMEYTFEDVLEIIDNIPTLKIHKAKIKKEMDGCPSMMCRQIIETIKDKRVFLFEEDNLDLLVERIEKISKKDLYGIFIHITAKEKINKVNESMQKISEILKTEKINLGAGMKGNDHDKILLFVSYNKKDGEAKEE